MRRFPLFRVALRGCVLCVLGLAGSARAQTSPPVSDRFDAARDVLQNAVNQRIVGSAVGLIAFGDQILLLHAAGEIEPGEPMPVNAIARMASIQKPITALAVLMLHERGQLQLTDPVERWFPGFGRRVLASETDTVAAVRPVTVFDLLTHQAGLIGEGPEYDSLWETPTTREFSRRIGAIPLRFQPGSDFDYGCCGSAYEVLAAIVELVSGESLKDFLTANVLHPLGMRDTFFFVPEARAHRLATHYRVRNGTLAPFVRRGQESPESAFYAGGGSLRSTVLDYYRFLLMLLNGGELDGVRLAQPETVQAMLTNHIGSKYPVEGYGWGFGARVQVSASPAGTARPAGVGAYWWNGGTGTQFLLDPQSKLIAIVFAPTWPGTPGVGQVRNDFTTAAIAVGAP